MTNQVITSILDNDFYKFSMLNAVLKLYPNQQVEYKFHNRDNREFPENFDILLRKQLLLMNNLSLTQIEELYLRKEFSNIFEEDFFEYLKNYRFQSSDVESHMNGTQLEVTIKGTWEQTILWEVPLLAIISELYFSIKYPKLSLKKFKLDTAVKGKCIKAHKYQVIEFGTRRRFSKLVQSLAISILKINKAIIGTSNVYFGMIHNLPVKGTQAHEWIMYHGVYSYELANVLATTAWLNVYGVHLNTTLTDTYTSEQFFRTLSTNRGRLIKILRQDSGNPLQFTDRALAYYSQNDIDAKEKTIMYSDALNLAKIELIDNYLPGSINKIYGVGTYLTNDIEGVKPLNIVIKLHKVGKKYTVKLSDDKGKHTGDVKEIEQCKKDLQL